MDLDSETTSTASLDPVDVIGGDVWSSASGAPPLPPGHGGLGIDHGATGLAGFAGDVSSGSPGDDLDGGFGGSPLVHEMRSAPAGGGKGKGGGRKIDLPPVAGLSSDLPGGAPAYEEVPTGQGMWRPAHDLVPRFGASMMYRAPEHARDVELINENRGLYDLVVDAGKAELEAYYAGGDGAELSAATRKHVDELNKSSGNAETPVSDDVRAYTKMRRDAEVTHEKLVGEAESDVQRAKSAYEAAAEGERLFQLEREKKRAEGKRDEYDEERERREELEGKAKDVVKETVGTAVGAVTKPAEFGVTKVFGVLSKLFGLFTSGDKQFDEQYGRILGEIAILSEEAEKAESVKWKAQLKAAAEDMRVAASRKRQAILEYDNVKADLQAKLDGLAEKEEQVEELDGDEGDDEDGEGTGFFRSVADVQNDVTEAATLLDQALSMYQQRLDRPDSFVSRALPVADVVTSDLVEVEGLDLDWNTTPDYVDQVDTWIGDAQDLRTSVRFLSYWYGNEVADVTRLREEIFSLDVFDMASQAMSATERAATPDGKGKRKRKGKRGKR